MSLYNQITSRIPFKGVTIDSRNCPEGSVFFAIRGERFDGNLYAAQALEKGCALAVVDRPECATDDRFLLVDNATLALQQMARDHRISLGLPVIGITGTNGKTTTKELTAAVLSQKFNLHYTQGNLNNAIGVPLTLLQMRPEHQLAIVEMGASHPGDISELVNIACPNAGLITNVGVAHLEGFGSFEGVKKTKGELYDYLRHTGGFIFRNLDNADLAAMAAGLNTVGYSLTQEDSEVFGRITDGSGLLRMEVRIGSAVIDLQTRLVGAYNAENVLAACCMGHYFGLTPEQIKAGIEGYVPTNNRSMLLQTDRNTLIVDAYNANPTSMRAAIGNLAATRADNLTLILGDMLELGPDSLNQHQQLVDYIDSLHLDSVVLVGSEFAATRNRFTCLPDTQALRDHLTAHPFSGRRILIKGSHGMHLDTITDLM